MRFREILNEYNKPKLIELFRDKFEEREGFDIQKSLYHLDEYLKEHDLSKIIDPYVKWIVQRYTTNGINRWEDVYARVIAGLFHYDRLKKTRQLSPEETDINRFQSESELLDVVEKYKKSDTSSQQEKRSKIEQSFYDKNEARLLYNDEDYKIVQPRTEKASCFFGQNTRWCTAATRGENFFKSYTKKGPLYIVLNKKRNERWQLHFETDEFRDEKDRYINFSELIKDPKMKKIIYDLFKDEMDSMYIDFYYTKSEKPMKFIELLSRMTIDTFNRYRVNSYPEEIRTRLIHQFLWYMTKDLSLKEVDILSRRVNRSLPGAVRNDAIKYIQHYKYPSKKQKFEIFKRIPELRIEAIKTLGDPVEFEGNLLPGLRKLDKHQSQKVDGIFYGLKAIQEYVKKEYKQPVTWKTIKWDILRTYKRYGRPGGLGSNVVITGRMKNGTPVRYIYNQPSSAESGQRFFKIDKQGRRTISDIEKIRTPDLPPNIEKLKSKIRG